MLSAYVANKNAAPSNAMAANDHQNTRQLVGRSIQRERNRACNRSRYLLARLHAMPSMGMQTALTQKGMSSRTMMSAPRRKKAAVASGSSSQYHRKRFHSSSTITYSASVQTNVGCRLTYSMILKLDRPIRKLDSFGGRTCQDPMSQESIV